MKANISKLQRRKQGGFIMTTELVLLVTTMVVGMIVGLVTMRDSVTAEMEDVAEAIGSLDQSYAFDGIKNAELTAEVSGSGFVDSIDTNAGDQAEFTYFAPTYNETPIEVAGPIGAGSSSAGNTGTR